MTNEQATPSTPPEITEAAARLLEHLPPEPWAPWPGGWPNAIELAVLDAVFSVRARYGKDSPDPDKATGVRGVLARWRRLRDHSEPDDLPVLARFDGDELAHQLNNKAKIAGALKATVAIQVAATLSADTGGISLRHASEFPDDHGRAYEALKGRWLSTPGLGPVTWSYFCMLLGRPDVKADVMIRRYLSRNLGLASDPSPEQARQIVLHAAQVLRLHPTALDHAIWAHERSWPSLPPPNN